MSNPEPFQQLLRLLGRNDETIRIARGNATDFAAAPVHFSQLGPALETLEAERMNVWFEINPSMYDAQGGRSSAQHITRLTALYADLDFKEKPGGLGSLPEAMEVVADLSSALGTQPSVIVHSGHGIQPYWPIADAEIHEQNRNDIAALLKRWGLLVKQTAAANHGAADSVFDLPRILRVPGSVNFKDDANPKPATADFYEGIAPLDVAWINEVLDDYGIVADSVEVGGEVLSAMADWEWAEVDCAFHAMALHEIRTSAPTARHPWALKWASLIYGMIRYECVTENGFYQLREALIERFQYLLKAEGNTRQYSTHEMSGILKTGQSKAESWSKQKLGEEMRQHTHSFSPDFSAGSRQVAGSGAPLPAETPTNVSSIFTRQRLSAVADSTTFGALALNTEIKSQQRMMSAAFTDTGNSERLGQWLRGKFIFVPNVGWHEWTGVVWQPDTAGAVIEAAKDMFIQMLTTAPDDAHRKWAHTSLNRGRLNAAVEYCKSIPHLVVTTLQLDAKPYELNTPAGIVNLHDGSIRPADPLTDFHTLQTSVAPKRGDMPKFMAFIMWAMSESIDDLLRPGSRVLYMQRLFGLAAIGKLIEHVFPICIGGGQNGKSALLETIAGALGAYATVMPKKFLVETRGEAHPTEIAQLRGVRMALNSEVPPDATFDESLIKQITGDGRLKARYMNKDFFFFENTSTHFLLANNLPAVKFGGTSFWRRSRKIDFRNEMPLKQQNKNLITELLAAEGPAILQWVIDGAASVLKVGLQDPDTVLIATREYQLEEDTIARFMDSFLTEVEGIETDREQVFALYQWWVTKQGYTALPYIKFCREITQISPKSNLGTRAKFTNMALSAYTVDEEEGEAS